MHFLNFSLAGLVHHGIHYGHHMALTDTRSYPILAGHKNRMALLDAGLAVQRLKYGLALARSIGAKNAKILFVNPALDSIDFMSTRIYDDYLNFSLTFRKLPGILSNYKGLSRYLSNNTGSLRPYFRSARRKPKRRKLPAMALVFQSHDHYAVREATYLNLPYIALFDSNTNAALASFYNVPANDDSLVARKFFVSIFFKALRAGFRSFLVRWFISRNRKVKSKLLAQTVAGPFTAPVLKIDVETQLVDKTDQTSENKSEEEDEEGEEEDSVGIVPSLVSSLPPEDDKWYIKISPSLGYTSAVAFTRPSWFARRKELRSLLLRHYATPLEPNLLSPSYLRSRYTLRIILAGFRKLWVVRKSLRRKFLHTPQARRRALLTLKRETGLGLFSLLPGEYPQRLLGLKTHPFPHGYTTPNDIHGVKFKPRGRASSPVASPVAKSSNRNTSKPKTVKQKPRPKPLKPVVKSSNRNASKTSKKKMTKQKSSLARQEKKERLEYARYARLNRLEEVRLNKLNRERAFQWKALKKPLNPVARKWSFRREAPLFPESKPRIVKINIRGLARIFRKLSIKNMEAKKLEGPFAFYHVNRIKPKIAIPAFAPSFRKPGPVIGSRQRNFRNRKPHRPYSGGTAKTGQYVSNSQQRPLTMAENNSSRGTHFSRDRHFPFTSPRRSFHTSQVNGVSRWGRNSGQTNKNSAVSPYKDYRSSGTPSQARADRDAAARKAAADALLPKDPPSRFAGSRQKFFDLKFSVPPQEKPEKASAQTQKKLGSPDFLSRKVTGFALKHKFAKRWRKKDKRFAGNLRCVIRQAYIQRDNIELLEKALRQFELIPSTKVVTGKAPSTKAAIGKTPSTKVVTGKAPSTKAAMGKKAPKKFDCLKELITKVPARLDCLEMLRSLRRTGITIGAQPEMGLGKLGWQFIIPSDIPEKVPLAPRTDAGVKLAFSSSDCYALHRDYGDVVTFEGSVAETRIDPPARCLRTIDLNLFTDLKEYLAFLRYEIKRQVLRWDQNFDLRVFTKILSTHKFAASLYRNYPNLQESFAVEGKERRRLLLRIMDFRHMNPKTGRAKGIGSYLRRARRAEYVTAKQFSQVLGENYFTVPPDQWRKKNIRQKRQLIFLNDNPLFLWLIGRLLVYFKERRSIDDFFADWDSGKEILLLPVFYLRPMLKIITTQYPSIKINSHKEFCDFVKNFLVSDGDLNKMSPNRPDSEFLGFSLRSFDADFKPKPSAVKNKFRRLFRRK